MRNKSKLPLVLFIVVLFLSLMTVCVHASSQSVMDKMFLNQVKYEDEEFIYSTQAFVGGYARYQDEVLNTKQGFKISFDYKCISEDKGADGIMLNFETSKSLFGTSIDGSYGVEFNSYHTSIWDPHPIEDPHVAITKDKVSNHYKYNVNSLIWNSNWNNIAVEYRGTKLSIYVNSIMVLSDDNIVLPDKVVFTIAAIDGLNQSRRYVKNVKLDYEKLVLEYK